MLIVSENFPQSRNNSPSRTHPFGNFSVKNFGAAKIFPYLEYRFDPFQNALTPSSFSLIKNPVGS